MSLPPGYTLRSATSADAALIAQQREAMFVDMGRTYREAEAHFARWVQPRLEQGVYLGWLVEHAGETVAGAGLILQDWPPGALDPRPLRGYLDNIYTHPDHRGRGLARVLVQGAVAEAQARDIRFVSLYASEAGRPLYEQLGFKTGHEMHLVLGAEVPA